MLARNGDAHNRSNGIGEPAMLTTRRRRSFLRSCVSVMDPSRR